MSSASSSIMMRNKCYLSLSETGSIIMVPTVQFSQGRMSSTTLQHLPQEEPLIFSPKTFLLHITSFSKTKRKNQEWPGKTPNLKKIFPPNLSPLATTLRSQTVALLFGIFGLRSYRGIFVKLLEAIWMR